MTESPLVRRGMKEGTNQSAPGDPASETPANESRGSDSRVAGTIKSRLFNRVTARLFCWFLGLALIPMVILIAVSLNRTGTAIHDDALRKLMLIATEKRYRVEDYIHQVKEASRRASFEPHVRTVLEAASQSPVRVGDLLAGQLREELQPIFGPELEASILNKFGQVVVSTEPRLMGSDLSRTDYFLKGRKATLLTDIFYDTLTQRMTWMASSPVVGDDGTLLGVVVNRIDPHRLTSITNSRKSERDNAGDDSPSGFRDRVYLVNRDGLLLTEALIFPDSLFSQVVDTKPVRYARDAKKRMCGDYPDIRRTKVAGASEVIADCGWVVIAEMDYEQAMAPYVRFRNGILILSLAVFALMFVLVVRLGAIVARPLRTLILAEERSVTEGQPVALVPEDQIPDDEIGKLIRRRNEGIQRILAAEKRHRDLVDEIDGIAWEADVGTWRFTFVNWRAEKILGYPVEQWLSEPGFWVGHLHSLDRSRTVQAYLETSITGKDLQLEYRMIASDGRAVWLRDHAHIVDSAAATGGGPIRQLHGLMIDITAAKQTQEFLQESERRSRMIIDMSRDAVVGVDSKGNVSVFNHVAERMFRIPAKEMIGTSPARLVPEDLRDRHLKAISRFLETGRPNGMIGQPRELRGLRSDGSVFPMEISLTPTRDKSIRVLAAIQDITAQKKAIEELLESEERHRTVLQTAMDGFWITDTQGRLLEVNEAYCRMSGYSAPELLAMRIPDLETAETADGTAAHIQKIMAQGEDRFESRHHRKDGSILDVEASVQYQPTDGGRLVVFLRDITARKKAIEELLESEERHWAVLRTAMDGFWMTDTQGRLLEVNEAYCRMSGYSAPELLAMRVPDLEVGNTASDIAARIQTIMAQGEDRFESRHRRKDGSVFEVEISIQYQPTDGGRLVAFLRDITEHKQAEDALRESEYRWKFAIEGSGDGLWDWNVPESAVFFSTRWKEMLGFAEDEIGSGLDEWSKRVHPDDLARVRADVQAHLAGTTPLYINEHRVSCRDGSWKWILDRGVVVSRDATGEPLRMIGTHADITERKRADEELLGRYRQLDGLHKLADAIIRAQTVDEICAQAISCAKFTLQADRASVVSFDPDGLMRIKAWDGLSDKYRAETEERMLWSEEESDPRPLLVSDVQFIVEQKASQRTILSEADLEKLRPLILGEGIRALCAIPLIYQGRILGRLMVYFDTPHRFTGEEIQLAQTIAAHVAFAIGRQRASDVLRAIVGGVSRSTGAEFFRILIRHLANAFHLRWAFVGETVGAGRGRIRTLALWAGSDYAPNFEYDLAGTPCEGVMGRAMCCYPRDVARTFPQDHLLVKLGVEGYVGVRLSDSSGNSLGILVVMNDTPIREPSPVQSTLSVFAARAGAELERLRTEQGLKREQQWYRSMCEHIAEAFLICDADTGRLIEANPVLQTLLGHTRDELLAMTLYEIIYDDPATVERYIQDHIRGPHHTLCRMRYRHKDGTPVEVETSTSLFVSDQQRALFVLVRFADREAVRLVSNAAQGRDCSPVGAMFDSDGD